MPEPGADAAAPALLARPGDGGPGRPRPSHPFALQTDFSQKRGACVEAATAPIADEARCWERAVSTALPELLTPRGEGGGTGDRENPARERGNGSGGGQIRRGKRALSFPACKQKDNAENAAVLMWFYGGEGSVLLLLRVFVQGRL